MQFVIVNRRMAELRREAESDRIARGGAISRIVRLAARTRNLRPAAPVLDRRAA